MAQTPRFLRGSLIGSAPLRIQIRCRCRTQRRCPESLVVDGGFYWLKVENHHETRVFGCSSSFACQDRASFLYLCAGVWFSAGDMLRQQLLGLKSFTAAMSAQHFDTTPLGPHVFLGFVARHHHHHERRILAEHRSGVTSAFCFHGGSLLPRQSFNAWMLRCGH